jgi:hypothetical protein
MTGGVVGKASFWINNPGTVHTQFMSERTRTAARREEKKEKVRKSKKSKKSKKVTIRQNSAYYLPPRD